VRIKSPKQKILIIEYYLAHKSNGLQSIAKDLDITLGGLAKLVDNYKKDNCLILPSKMN
jgi:hypothetical protein